MGIGEGERVEGGRDRESNMEGGVRERTRTRTQKLYFARIVV